MYLVTANEMREMDRRTIESFEIPGRILMENAGKGAARVLFEKFPDLNQKKIGVIAGKGNNGGDGFVIARYLFQKGIDVAVYLLTSGDQVKGDAKANLDLLAPLGVPVFEVPDKKTFQNNKTSLIHRDILVDAILGTGIKSDVKGYFREIIEFINELKRPVLAVDIPSGLNADTGQPCGVCIRADTTATFAYAKTGHILFPGADYTGDLEIIDIDIPPHIAEQVKPLQHLITTDMIKSCLQPRPADAHKGTTGHLLVIAGSTGKTGAAAMIALSAMRTGAGLVTLGIPESLNAIMETLVLEAMTEPLLETEEGMIDEASLPQIMNLMPGKKCIAIGPGTGTSSAAKNILLKIISASNVPVVIDADGLNNLAGNVAILKDLKTPAVITPHPGEMARLINSTAGDVQKDRVACSRNFAVNHNVHVVLKGARTIIAHPDGTVFINPTGNPGMAAGGMGDVLTGIIAGLITQGYPPESAARMGVYLHGAAADALAETTGPVGFLASEVMQAIPGQIAKYLSVIR